MKSKFSTLLLTSFLLSTVTYGQNALSKKIDSLLSEIVTPNEPGFSVGIVKNGKFIYKNGFGLADMATKRKNTPETPFNIGSTSKEFTAACIYILAEQGKLKTTDKLSKYFKGWPKYADSITIAHLINHQSGLRDYDSLIGLRTFDDNAKVTETLAYEMLIRQKRLNFKAGSQFSYTNSGYFLLSLIVKKISGKDLIAFSKQYIFDPLKMTNTNYSHTHQVKGKANGYVSKGTGFEKITVESDVIGQGNIYSRVTDWDHWFKEMKNHHQLGEKVWKNMLTNNKTDDGEPTGYGGGLEFKTYKNKRLTEHGGDLSGYHTAMWYLPEKDLGIVVFSNNDNAKPELISGKIFDEIYPATADPKKPENDGDILPIKTIKIDTSAITGSYRFDNDSSKIFQVTTLGNQIMLFQKWNDTNYPIRSLNDSLFYIDKGNDITFQFKSVANGKADQLKIVQNGSSKKATRTTVKMALMDFQGNKMSFYSPEMNAHYLIMKENENLYLLMNNPAHQYKIELVALKEKNRYLLIGCDMYITFKYNNEKLTGFVLDHERIKDLYFAKE
ncbi:serine hydrolase domain-containing protein [Pedobacter sp. UBA5917]|jgi:CubicO group peptidase (beta-lactamase class C family)|uniref:serine hydrolase domain-containing protein n=1 Tax=Pedobacter sp. UBA5917 TaxID=1947061 RepID=UPI0025E9ADC1|nr:serine hydrolase domain-containing protein [Pedobacter sp. UBA5917]